MYTLVDVSNKKLNDFLGVKYIISCSDNVENYGYKHYTDIDNYKIYLNDNYLKFGSYFNDYISSDEFNKLDSNNKIDILNKKIILNEKQIKKYSKFYPNNVSYSKNKFKFIKNGFISEIVSSDESIALYQIPYDSGWECTNNGKKVEIENIDNGFIGIKIHKGSNKIKFKYEVPGLKLGIIISIISLLSSFGYLLYIKKSSN